ncbi:hypothetical protein [Metabacillus niabensis]|uniref:hypothetical protein n=1 Tax=Metabacillus niabensis TaxID=324854 RepID=UPI0011A40209
MSTLKCVFCKREFKDTDEIMTVDDISNHVHTNCHYDYLSNQHLNATYTLSELKEALEKED